jgi:proteic killer suppression protein
MIQSIRHKGLNRLYQNDDSRGVIQEHREKLRDILARLDVASTIDDMRIPGFRLHPLLGEFEGFWAVIAVRIGGLSFASPKVMHGTSIIWIITESHAS